MSSLHTVMRYIGTSKFQQNWGQCEDPSEVLNVGDRVWITKEEVHNWHTKLWVNEDRGPFQSTSFEECSGELILVRGLPGSGKSTLAKDMLKDGLVDSHYEADMYYMKDDEYVFDPEKIPEAHKWCRDKAREDLSKGLCVVVSNTFTQRGQLKAYLDMPWVEVSILVCKESYGSVHEVPPDVLAKMAERWED